MRRVSLELARRPKTKAHEILVTDPLSSLGREADLKCSSGLGAGRAAYRLFIIIYSTPRTQANAAPSYCATRPQGIPADDLRWWDRAQGHGVPVVGVRECGMPASPTNWASPSAIRSNWDGAPPTSSETSIRNWPTQASTPARSSRHACTFRVSKCDDHHNGRPFLPMVIDEAHEAVGSLHVCPFLR